MLTATFYLYGVVDGENAHYMQLSCSLPVVSVDENNVQADAAVFRLVEVNGSTQTVIPAWFRLKVMAGNAVIDTIDQTVVKDELSYMLPTDRYGNADKLVVEAYQDDHETEGSYDEKLAELTVPVSRRNPIPFPRPEEWSAGLTFRNGEYLMVGNIVYMWRNPVAGNSSLTPEQDIEQNPQTTSWVAYQNWPLLATQVFLAQWAKLGSAVFSGDYMFSQQGIDNTGNIVYDYRNFTPDMANFLPMIYFNFFNGACHLGAGAVKIDEFGRILRTQDDIIVWRVMANEITEESIIDGVYPIDWRKGAYMYPCYDMTSPSSSVQYLQIPPSSEIIKGYSFHFQIIQETRTVGNIALKCESLIYDRAINPSNMGHIINFKSTQGEVVITNEDGYWYVSKGLEYIDSFIN